ncbi:transcription elongation factor S-II-like [Lineus longissimus]|uniref:transcription elongation factor S-II-like n=1 Tax=Lineus longissimus TaxID=88925 RepID=UPI002B4EA2B9
MSSEEDVMKIGKKLKEMASSETVEQGPAQDMLDTLRGMKMNMKVLQKTRIGLTVNSFRKACETAGLDSLAKQSKALIKDWKKLLDQGNAKGGDDDNKALKREDSISSTSGEVSSRKSSTDTPPPKQSSFSLKNSDTTDSVRLKCREMLKNALVLPEGTPLEGAMDPEEIAIAIEDSIYTEMMNTDMKYKNRVRSRIANLKDSKNVQLKENVLLGNIRPEKIAVMTAEEMANDAMKKLREKFTKEAINDHQMAVQTGTQTDLLKCGKCGKRRCSYNQVQTRSADEPMTTFVFCNDCGHRWKFC